MGLDLRIVREPDIVPADLPEILRESPAYFRGVPYEALAAAGILDDEMESAEGPDWPPAGMTKARAEEILRLFERPCDDDPETSVIETKPTYHELRRMQKYVEESGRTLSKRSRKRGKVPSFKFLSNDGWHVVPEECLVIAYRLHVFLEGGPQMEGREEVHAFAVFNELAAKYGGYEVW